MTFVVAGSNCPNQWSLHIREHVPGSSDGALRMLMLAHAMQAPLNKSCTLV